MEDLAAYHVRCDPPVHVHYRGYDVYGTGPWGQGPVFPQALKLLDGFDLKGMGHNSAEYLHTVIQALNLALADREQYIADPEFVDVPLDALLSDAYLGERRQLIDPQHAWTEMPPPGDPRAGRAVLNGAAMPVATTGMSLSDQAARDIVLGVIDKAAICFPALERRPSRPHHPQCRRDFSAGSQSKSSPHLAALAPQTASAHPARPVLRQPFMAFGGWWRPYSAGDAAGVLNLIEFGLDPQEAVEGLALTYNFHLLSPCLFSRVMRNRRPHRRSGLGTPTTGHTVEELPIGGGIIVVRRHSRHPTTHVVGWSRSSEARLATEASGKKL